MTLKKKSTKISRANKPSIDVTADKTMFDDVKNTPEFKRGYEKEMLKEFAFAIKTLRAGQGLTQKQVAAKAGTKQQVVSRLENGVEDIKLSTFFRIANVLRMNLESFVHAARR